MGRFPLLSSVVFLALAGTVFFPIPGLILGQSILKLEVVNGVGRAGTVPFSIPVSPAVSAISFSISRKTDTRPQGYRDQKYHKTHHYSFHLRNSPFPVFL
jgi:hypothetical protein